MSSQSEDRLKLLGAGLITENDFNLLFHDLDLVPTIKLFFDRWVTLKLLNVSLSISSHINFEHIDREIVIIKLNHPEHENIKPRGMN